MTVARHPPDRRKTGVPTLKVFGVLEAVVHAERAPTTADLAARLQIPIPTMHRIVAMLVGEGMLRREPGTRRLGPGHRLLGFGLRTLEAAVRWAPGRALLEAASARVGETVNLGALDGAAVVYLDRVEASWPLGLRFESGSRVPLHCTAMGKLLLAHMPPGPREAMVGALTLTRYTEATITSALRLRRELDRILEQGFSVDDQEFLAGVVCLAAPIRDGLGAVRAAIAISAPAVRLGASEITRHLPVLHKAAERLGETLFPAAPEAGAARPPRVHHAEL
ncbi:MAG: IclR family transcriptional regulator [Acetobacteraceae bacterium]